MIMSKKLMVSKKFSSASSIVKAAHDKDFAIQNSPNRTKTRHYKVTENFSKPIKTETIKPKHLKSRNPRQKRDYI